MHFQRLKVRMKPLPGWMQSLIKDHNREKTIADKPYNSGEKGEANKSRGMEIKNLKTDRMRGKTFG